jgi:HAMP domain-containing protein
MWTSFDLQKHYLETYLPKHSKNNLGLKLFAVANNFKVALPSENSDLDLFIEKIRAQEAQNFLKVKFNNQDGLFISIPGKRVSNFYLIGILPSENITREVKNTEAYMMKLFITCLLISVAFGFVTSSSVLRPLSALEQATDAIHKRDFTFRLPDLGNNEFGSLGMVINDLFVDYEEVFNASIIREKLLDSLEEPVQIGNLTIVSRSFVLSDSCPDFLHVKRPGEKELGFFLGTVEQTGVSANLILALTKGAIIQFECDDCQVSESLGMLQELFETFNQNSAHQKTISLLHGIVDGENSKVKFLNAGLKYALVWKQGILQVLKLPDNPPVGNAECNNFTYLEIPVNEGEILFLFSNGISSHDQLEQICNALNEVISKRRLEGGITQLIFGYFHEQLVTQKLKKDLSLVVIY